MGVKGNEAQGDLFSLSFAVRACSTHHSAPRNTCTARYTWHCREAWCFTLPPGLDKLCITKLHQG